VHSTMTSGVTSSSETTLIGFPPIFT
jgi:hypothetical protein